MQFAAAGAACRAYTGSGSAGGSPGASGHCARMAAAASAKCALVPSTRRLMRLKGAPAEGAGMCTATRFRARGDSRNSIALLPAIPRTRSPSAAANCKLHPQHNQTQQIQTPTCGVQHAAARLLQHERPRAQVPAAAQPNLVKHVQPVESRWSDDERVEQCAVSMHGLAPQLGNGLQCSSSQLPAVLPATALASFPGLAVLNCPSTEVQCTGAGAAQAGALNMTLYPAHTTSCTPPSPAHGHAAQVECAGAGAAQAARALAQLPYPVEAGVQEVTVAPCAQLCRSNATQVTKLK